MYQLLDLEQRFLHLQTDKNIHSEGFISTFPLTSKPQKPGSDFCLFFLKFYIPDTGIDMWKTHLKPHGQAVIPACPTQAP